ncbi:TPA: phage portal protein [Pseudomonas aeruginosa]|uniref:phage portal protein n=1 Tax=Pseudomonas aeruginosa TaxID=287 RepID=UPI0003BB117E|nr:phage portal protein [Pseudomonas aeruginosa]ELG7179622.1 phage portal protein [Pseudomonas aeruginosa]ERX34819.1 HK97 family phage portal protein [Pseudomonas aeruginosa U2504]KSG57781.1 phage portal protein [Pseudomonas aeruginosa]KSR47822.1 phage portal protein [Pseudomonas aeruginosa]MBG4806240.1 phage portal protein [Pseudomonas aeruginosa]
MGILKKLGRWFGKGSDPLIIDTPEKLAQVLGVAYETESGQLVTTTTAMQQTVVFNCVRVLAESVGMLPCRLFKQTERERIPALSNRLYDVLAVAPNGYMTAQEFWELLVVCLCLRGNFYAYKVMALGNVVELLPINPAAVKPKLKDDWTVEYDVTFKSGVETLSQDEIWHVRLFTLDGLTGLNPIAYARQVIGLNQAMETHAAKLFSNGAVTSGVLKTDQTLSDEAFERLSAQFQGEHMGTANAYKPMILEMGLDWKPISLNAQDTQFIESRKMTEAQLCGLFRVPPHLVANLDKMTLNNIEHMGMSFVNYSLVPILTRIEARIRVGLLSEKDAKTHFAKFNAGALMRGDLNGRYTSYGKGIQWGILSPNDCRELEDLNPRPGGDIYLTPTNMTTNPEALDADKTTP